jgi:peptide/nickel transport system permease protein
MAAPQEPHAPSPKRYRTMTRYALSRLGQLVLVLIGVSMVVFFTMHVLPGDVATLLLGERATEAQLTQLRHQLGLDQPVWMQYLDFAAQAARGDLGTSLRSNHPALDDVWTAFPVTFQLALASLAIAVALGVPLGVLAGTRPGGWLDNAVLTLTLFGVSMPIFWLGLMLLLLFGAWLGWLPIGGLMPTGLDVPRVTGMTVLDSLIAGRADLLAASVQYLILPAVTLATIPLAMITRITRSEMLATAGLDHVRTARAKGMPERRVIVRHIFRNALIPVVTVIGLQLGLLLSGAVLTETIFALPGLGRLMVDSILSRDYPVVQAGALFIAFVFVLVNLLVDLSYALLDPRIRRA